MGQYRLVVKEGKDAGRVFHLKGPTVILGRPGAEGESKVEFEEPTVSRVHAVLQWREDQGCYELSNRSFNNPARVNGEPATSGALLVHGTRIQLGELTAQIRDAELDAVPDAKPFMGCLELIHGPGYPGIRFPLNREPISIGQSPDCEVHLPSPALSPHHASIEWYGSLPVLLPLSSRGIFVNGEPVNQGTFLRANDFILLGTGVALSWLPLSVLAREKDQAQKAEQAAREAEQAAREADQEAQAQAAAELQATFHPPADLPEAEPRPEATPLEGRAAFFADLARRLESREPIRQAVHEVASARLPRLAPSLSDEMLSGQGLADAMAGFPADFTPYELGMVAAGEEAGILERQLHVLTDSLVEAARRRGRLVRWWVCLLPTLGVGLPLLLLLPLLVERGPIAYGAGCAASLAGAVLLAVLLRAGHAVARRSAAFRRAQEQVLGRLPVLQRRSGARFLEVLGPLLGSGVKIPRATLLAAGCTGSPAHTLLLIEAAGRIEQGSPVLDALAPTGLFAPEVLAEIEQGEEHGDLPDRLTAASGRTHQSAQVAMERAIPFLVAAPALLWSALSVLAAGMVRLLVLN